jgi:hypothetical protein
MGWSGDRGQAAVLDGSPPSTGLMTMTTVSERLLPRAGFLRLLEEERSVREHVLAQLARDVIADRVRLDAFVRD